MNISRRSEPIHRWDGPSQVKALIFGTVAEGLAILPAILSPWGHAGPESSIGWLSVLLNVPGAFLLGLLTGRGIEGGESVAVWVAGIYAIQTLVISYLAFLWLRRRKLRA